MGHRNHARKSFEVSCDFSAWLEMFRKSGINQLQLFIFFKHWKSDSSKEITYHHQFEVGRNGWFQAQPTFDL